MTRRHPPRALHGRAHRGRAPRGVALLDALMGAVVGAIVLIAALGTIVRVTRFTREQDARSAAHTTLEQAATALAADLRPLATAASGDDPSDLRAVSDTTVEITATIGGGVACAITTTATASTVDLASAPDANTAPALTWWNASPRPGDVAFVHDDAGTASATDDGWTVRAVHAVSEGTSYCRSGPFAGAAAASSGANRLRLTLDPPALSATAAAAGAPIRIARRRRYSLYRATDGWQLGVRDWDGTDWETVQPIAGPFATPGANGLRIEAVDASGTPVTGNPPPQPAVELRVRLRALCSARDPRLRCSDTTLAVIRPRGNA